MTSVVLCAYQDIGCRVLEHVAARADVDDVFVYTHDPGPGIRDVRETARELGVPFSTENISKVELPFTPDVIASVYYRWIIKPAVIDACGGRIFNTHPSLLPRHRGCSSVPWSIIEGDSVTGVTFHYIDEGIDTGRIILQVEIPIARDETQTSLYNRCMSVGAEHWPRAFELVRDGAAGSEQEGDACYHPRGAPLGGEIDPSWDDELVERFIRAMTFPPLPYATFRGHEVQTFDDYLRLRG